MCETNILAKNVFGNLLVVVNAIGKYRLLMEAQIISIVRKLALVSASGNNANWPLPVKPRNPAARISRKLQSARYARTPKSILTGIMATADGSTLRKDRLMSIAFPWLWFKTVSKFGESRIRLSHRCSFVSRPVCSVFPLVNFNHPYVSVTHITFFRLYIASVMNETFVINQNSLIFVQDSSE